MRIGLSIRPDRDRPADQLLAAAQAAERAGFSTIWVAQTPSGFDALSAVTVMGQATHRIELGTAVVPIQSRHPIAMAQQALSVQAVCEGRLTLGLGVSHHWIVQDMLGVPYEKPAAHMRAYLEVLAVALAGPDSVDVENDFYRVHNPLDITDVTPTPILLAALAPLMLRLAGESAAGTILWMADERAISDHIVPRITKAASEAGRATPRVIAGVPVVLCRSAEVGDVRAAVKARYGYVESAPNYARLLARGDATDVTDVLVAGDEQAVLTRLGHFRDAGATDFDAIVFPFGPDDAALKASKQRTEAFLASAAAEL